MDALCPPVITTAALFVALIFLDLLRREFELLPGHGFMGIISVLLMSILCQHNLSIVAWGLLVFPFLILIFGWGIQAYQGTFVPITARPYDMTMNASAVGRSPVKCRKTHF